MAAQMSSEQNKLVMVAIDILQPTHAVVASAQSHLCNRRNRPTQPSQPTDTTVATDSPSQPTNATVAIDQRNRLDRDVQTPFYFLPCCS